MRFINVCWEKTNPIDYRSAIKMTAIAFKGKVLTILSGIGVFKVLEKLLSVSNGIFWSTFVGVISHLIRGTLSILSSASYRLTENVLLYRTNRQTIAFFLSFEDFLDSEYSF